MNWQEIEQKYNWGFQKAMNYYYHLKKPGIAVAEINHEVITDANGIIIKKGGLNKNTYYRFRDIDYRFLYDFFAMYFIKFSVAIQPTGKVVILPHVFNDKKQHYNILDREPGRFEGATLAEAEKKAFEKGFELLCNNLTYASKMGGIDE